MAATTRLFIKEAMPGYAAGSRITDPAEMKRVQAEYPDHILREVVPAEAAPAKATQDAAVAAPKAAPAPGVVTTHTINDKG